MKPFVEWLKSRPFYVRQNWNWKKGELSGPGKLVLAPHQERILAHCLTPDENNVLPYTTIVYSCPMKSGKTTLAAAVGTWAAEEFDEGSEIYAIANDEEQARCRVFGDISYHTAKLERHDIRRLALRVEWPNDTFVQVLAKEHRSASGSRRAVTLWDELWAYQSDLSRKMWDEMTPIPTVRNSLRVIVTYAGFINESKLLWDIYKENVGPEEHKDGKGEKVPGLEDLPCWRHGRTFVYWDHEPRMPWQTRPYYEEQRSAPGMTPAAYLRFHENRWVTSHESFIPDEWWAEASRHFDQSAEIWEGHPYRYYPVSIAVDVAPKHDGSAVIGTTYDSMVGKAILLFHHIWTPREDEVFDLEDTVEKYLLWAFRTFNVNVALYDPAHFHRSMTAILKKGYKMVEYPQTVNNMQAATQQLFDLLRYKNLWAYPDDEIKAHLQNAVAESKGRGFRIVKNVTSAHVDAAVALAMSVYGAVERQYDSATEIRVDMPFADASGRVTERGDEFLPPQLRS